MITSEVMASQRRCSTPKINKWLLFLTCLTRVHCVVSLKATGTFWCAEEQKAAAQSVLVTTAHFWPGSCSWPGINKPGFLFSLDHFYRRQGKGLWGRSNSLLTLQPIVQLHTGVFKMRSFAIRMAVSLHDLCWLHVNEYQGLQCIAHKALFFPFTIVSTHYGFKNFGPCRGILYIIFRGYFTNCLDTKLIVWD